MYQKLMAKMQQNQLEKDRLAARKSPTVAAKVMHHISSRLVALMHEVTAGSSQDQDQQSPDDPDSAFVGRRQIGPPTRRFRPSSSASNKSDVSNHENVPSARDNESPDQKSRLKFWIWEIAECRSTTKLSALQRRRQIMTFGKVCIETRQGQSIHHHHRPGIML